MNEFRQVLSHSFIRHPYIPILQPVTCHISLGNGLWRNKSAPSWLLQVKSIMPLARCILYFLHRSSCSHTSVKDKFIMSVLSTNTSAICKQTKIASISKSTCTGSFFWAAKMQLFPKERWVFCYKWALTPQRYWTEQI